MKTTEIKVLINEIVDITGSSEHICGYIPAGATREETYRALYNYFFSETQAKSVLETGRWSTWDNCDIYRLETVKLLGE